MSFHSQWVIAIHFIKVHVACEVLCQCTCVAHTLQSCVHEARVAQIVEASSPLLCRNCKKMALVTSNTLILLTVKFPQCGTHRAIHVLRYQMVLT